MRKHHRASSYKFTEKKHSVRGILGLVLALASLAAGIVMIAASIHSKGNGSVYLGSGGILSMLAALAAFVLAVISMREEKSYRVFPIAALVWSILALTGWIAVYFLGFYGM